jgi:hypothetical protein
VVLKDHRNLHTGHLDYQAAAGIIVEAAALKS